MFREFGSIKVQVLGFEFFFRHIGEFIKSFIISSIRVSLMLPNSLNMKKLSFLELLIPLTG
jgi:hypothetical protein